MGVVDPRDRTWVDAMNAQTWQGAVARVSILAEGSYHAGDVTGAHELQRLAAAVLLLLLLCHVAEARIVAWRKRKARLSTQ